MFYFFIVYITHDILTFLGRLADLKTSLEYALGSDDVSSAQTPSTADPSPRRYFFLFSPFFLFIFFFFPQRFLPRLPNNEDEIIETSPAMTRRGAMSPSVASGIFPYFHFSPIFPFFQFSIFFFFSNVWKYKCFWSRWKSEKT